MIPITEIFASIQGEGVFSGEPCFFIRVSGCNLRCVFKGSICDTPYSSFKPEKDTSIQSVEDLIKAFKQMHEEFPRIKSVVITGGEPLLYGKELKEFLYALCDYDWFDHSWNITVETNGTMPMIEDPDNPLFDIFYSISPKLSTSVAAKPGVYGGYNVTANIIKNHDKKRINIENLADMICSNNVQLKFVYSGPESVYEILDICKKLEEQGVDPERLNKCIMLMPEGVTNDQLQTNREKIVEICTKFGWHYTDRLQIIIWGDKRGV